MSRAYCSDCERPKKSCICHLVIKIPHQHQINIIQHHAEVKQAKGTAKLAHLCLNNSSLKITNPKKERWQLAPNNVIVFPHEHAQPLSANIIADLQEKNCQFTFLDGTWRQANQLVNSCDCVENVNFIALPESISSQYGQLRKTKKAHALSSLEAMYCLLTMLEPNNLALPNLIRVFQSFLQFQQEFNPNENH